MSTSSIKITITGDLGSGKSSIAHLLADRLQLKYYSTGDLQREIAQKKGLTTLQLNHLAEKQSEIDYEIDNFSHSLNNSHENLIIDSRLAWFFVPNAFKIFLKVEDEIAVDRILKDGGRKSEKYISKEDALESIHQRQHSEEDRYQRLYGVDLRNYSNYDLVVNTSSRNIETVFTLIIDCFNKYQKNEPYSHFIE